MIWGGILNVEQTPNRTATGAVLQLQHLAFISAQKQVTPEPPIPMSGVWALHTAQSL